MLMKPILADSFGAFTALQKLRASKGGRVAYLKITTDLNEDRYRRELCLLGGPVFGEDVFPVLRDFAWLDEQTLICHAKTPADLGNATVSVLYALSVDTGEVSEYARFACPIGSFIPLSGGRCLVSASLPRETTPFKKANCYTATDIPFVMEGSVFSGDSNNVLCLYQNGELQELTSRSDDLGSFAVWKEDYVLAIVQDYSNILRNFGRIVYVDLKTGEARTLEEGIPKIYANLTIFAPDRFVITCTDAKLYGRYQDFTIEVRDLQNNIHGTWNQEADLSLFCSMNSDINFPDKHYIPMHVLDDCCYLVATLPESSHIMRLSFATGEIAQLTTGSGLVKDLARIEDKLYYIAARGLDGFALYRCALDGTNGEKLTNYNDAVDLEQWRGVPEPTSFMNPAGIEICGWVIKPRGFDPQKTYPAVLSIHGGPEMAYGPNYIHEIQYLAANGYGVFYCNPRGSVGRGGAFSDIGSRYFDIDVVDLNGFTDHVLAENPWIDKSRVGVMGGSYGGLMTSWLAGHNQHFAAIATERAVCNLISYFGTADIGAEWTDHILGTNIWEDVDKFWNYSAVKYAPDVNVPVLVIQCGLDYRCPAGTAFEFFHALKYHKKEARLLYFPKENHGLKLSGMPSSRTRRLEEIKDWFDRYLSV